MKTKNLLLLLALAPLPALAGDPIPVTCYATNAGEFVICSNGRSYVNLERVTRVVPQRPPPAQPPAPSTPRGPVIYDRLGNDWVGVDGTTCSRLGDSQLVCIRP